MPAPNAPIPDASVFDHLDDAAYQRALAILVDVGTSIVLELKAPSGTVSVADRAQAYKIVALAVRRAIILSKHIAEHPTRPPLGPTDGDTTRTMLRKQVIRDVGDAIEKRANPADAPALHVELLERMDSPDFDLDLAHQRVADVIAGLCRDLGVADQLGSRRSPRRTPDDIALLCAQAAAPAGSGLPQWSAAAARHCEERSDAAIRGGTDRREAPS